MNANRRGYTKAGLWQQTLLRPPSLCTLAESCLTELHTRVLRLRLAAWKYLLVVVIVLCPCQCRSEPNYFGHIRASTHRNDDRIYLRDLLDLARRVGVPFRPDILTRRAAVAEDGVE